MNLEAAAAIDAGFDMLGDMLGDIEGFERFLLRELRVSRRLESL